ncbi:MAG: hypothetical protein GXO21_02090 [Aquificae bacterium]|nr:hypothetical protein [Aquificota bacterium]
MFYRILSFFAFIILFSCGDGNGEYISAKAKLGNLAGADVEIFKVLDDGSLVLHHTEKTTDGYLLEDIGNFLIKIDNISDNDLFLIKVSGGLDWDSNDDGIKDKKPTKNKGTIRVFALGKDIKSLDGKLTVSLATELAYEMLAYDFTYSFEKESFLRKLNTVSQDILSRDINGDGIINKEDLLLFDPVVHKEYLRQVILSKLDILVERIYENSKFPPIFELKPVPIGFVPSGFAFKIRENNRVLFIGSPYGMHIYDVSNPLETFLYSSFATFDWIWNLDVKDNLLFIANLSEGFKIVDVSTPFTPNLLSIFYPGELIDDVPNAQSIEVADNDLVITANGIHGFSIYSVKNPQNPVELLTHKPCGTVLDAALKENIAYVLCKKSLKVIDISSLEEKFSYQTVKELSDLEVKEDKLAFSEFEGKVYIFDIKNRIKPELLTILSWDEDYIFSIRIKNNTLYIPLFYEGLYIVDLQNIQKLEKAILNIKMNENPYCVEEGSGLVFVGTKDGVYIFDLTVFNNF